MTRIEPATGRSYLERAGCTVLAHHGLRATVDLVRDERVQRDEQGFAAILELELALHDRSPYKDVARAGSSSLAGSPSVWWTSALLCGARSAVPA